MSTIEFNEQSLWLSFIAIASVPACWIFVSRLEECHNKTLTKLANGNATRAYIAWALTCLLMAVIRDASLEYALRRQPSSTLMEHSFLRFIAMCCWIGGNVIHFSAMWALGWKGIYHGDHFFGPLEYVESFPYSFIASPMYNGKAISYLGSAIWTAKPAGLVLAIWTFVVFNVTGMIEDQVTSEMYKDRNRVSVKED